MTSQTLTTITSMGHAHPQNLIPNAFFETLSDEFSADWISDRTGIQSRHSILSNEQIVALSRQETTIDKIRQSPSWISLAELSSQAWESLLSRLPNPQPDLVICGTSVPDYDIPANASLIADKLNLAATAFDVNSACSSFLTDLMVAHALMKAHAYRRVALFQVERYSTRLDYTDRKSCVLFGDGAAVSYLTNDPKASGLEVIDCFCASDPKGAQQVVIPESGLFWQNGAAVQKFAITRTVEATQTILERNGLSMGQVDYFVGHQANHRMLLSVCEKLGLPQEKHLYNVDRCGNQGGAGAPCVLSENWDRFQTGDTIVVSVVGSGLTWGSVLLRKR